MSENNIDVLQKETVSRDFKQVDGITSQFQKLAKECVSKVMQLNALYEDLGHIYERYYEMENINEGMPPIIPPMSGGGMNECDECDGCDDPTHNHDMPGEEEQEDGIGFEETL